MLIIASILVFVSIVMVLLAFSRPQSETVEGRLQKYGYGLASSRTRGLSIPFAQRVLFPILSNLVKLGNSLMPQNVKEKAEARLVLAGNPYGLNVDRLLTVSIIAGFILPTLYLGMALSTGRLPGPQEAITALALFGVGIYLLPNLWLNLQVSARQKQLERSLPDALDLITISVEAGLTLEAALAKVASRTSGPLAEEFGRALQEVSVGKARGKALRDIGKRTGVAELQSIIAVLVQSEEMGSSVAKVLRVQSDALRVKRQQRAQEQAHKAPIKMLFPLVLFIQPAMFVVILGPAAIKLINMFSGMK